MKSIVYMPYALKQLEALPEPVQAQIDDALDAYAMSGKGDVKALSGRTGYRPRVGRYRVIFDEDRLTILAFEVGKRETTSYRRH
jgi:mRNA interferase RelE/StbE